jgi:hypothetical protein
LRQASIAPTEGFIVRVPIRTRVIPLCLLLLTVLNGCAATEDSTLEGTSWVLEVPADQTGDGLLPVEVTLTFVSGDAVEGTHGPQKYAGGYAVEGDRISLDTLCFNPGLHGAGGTLNAEQDYLFDLEWAPAYGVDGDRLTLHIDRGTLN